VGASGSPVEFAAPLPMRPVILPRITHCSASPLAPGILQARRRCELPLLAGLIPYSANPIASKSSQMMVAALMARTAIAIPDTQTGGLASSPIMSVQGRPCSLIHIKATSV